MVPECQEAFFVPQSEGHVALMSAFRACVSITDICAYFGPLHSMRKIHNI